MTRQFILSTISFTLLITIILTSCCTDSDPKFNFENNEPKHIVCYHIGDTIYFQNEINDVDTITILSVDSAKGQACTGLMAPEPIGKSCWVTIKILPNDKWCGVKYEHERNNPPKTSIDYQKLIHFIKDPADLSTSFSFMFKDFVSLDTALTKLNKDTLVINSMKITDYYLIKHSFPERIKDSTDIVLIIWADGRGLTAYKNKCGNWWTKK
jgi:hypothetical protein